MSELTDSLAYVRGAIAALPEALATALETALPPLEQTPRAIVTTGIGASEAPARLLAAALAEAGRAARFCATSRFFADAPAADLLVVFSQGLSPNARLALTDVHPFAARWLVTSVAFAPPAPALKTSAEERAARNPGAAARLAGPSASQAAQPPPEPRALLEHLCARGVVPIAAPPAAEPGTLVRLIGPTVASLMALRLAAWLLGDGELATRLRAAPSAYRARTQLEPLDDAPVALVTVGKLAEAAHAHRWKLLEALLRGDPPVWDILQFAHGPLQSFHDRRLTLLVTERARDASLVERLGRTLDSSRHRLLRLASQHDDELAFFEHAAAIDALLLATLEASPRNLFDWPARHGDAPLYGLGAP